MEKEKARAEEEVSRGASSQMFIKSSVLPIEDVYSMGCQLQLPWFQRAYAWDEMHVGRLVHDLIEAMSGPRQRYSLGHMTLARPLGAPEASIIDGYQRSISLTILFALMRDIIAEGPVADRLHGLIEREAGVVRLLPQPVIAPFFRSFVQERGGSLKEPGGDLMDCSPSERNILANRDHMRSKLGDGVPEKQQLEALALFLIRKCVLILDEVEDEEEARDLLRREEETGLSPHSSELAKVTLLTTIPDHEQEEAAGLFEGVQTQLPADDVSSVLSHIRLLKTRKRSSRAVESDLIQRFQMQKSGLPFLRNELLPRAAAMVQLNRRDVGRGKAREQIKRSLDMLYCIDHQMWVPAALHWLDVMGANHPETPLFFARLDRLTYMMKIASVDPTDQEMRFIKVLEAIDAKGPVDDMAPLQIEKRLLAVALENLRSRTFYAKRFHSLVLRRISLHIDPELDPGPVDGDRVTVEHVLPRKPEAGMQWRRDFPGEDVANYCNRIGNLSFLSLEENNIAGNSDFFIKSLLLANAGGRFVLSARAGHEKEWTRDTIMRRGEEMISILLEPWQLKP